MARCSAHIECEAVISRRDAGVEADCERLDLGDRGGHAFERLNHRVLRLVGRLVGERSEDTVTEHVQSGLVLM